jgi:hypothetical protein
VSSAVLEERYVLLETLRSKSAAYLGRAKQSLQRNEVDARRWSRSDGTNNRFVKLGTKKETKSVSTFINATHSLFPRTATASSTRPA